MSVATIVRPTHSSFANQPTRAVTGSSRYFWNYTRHSLIAALKDWSFLAFIMAIPVTMYLFFANVYGNETTASGDSVTTTLMVTMATYGALGAAISAGNQIQTERSTGWFRQLMLTGLRPTQFVAARILVALGLVVPAVAAVFVAGAWRGVELTAAEWLSSLGLIVISLVPMVILGLTLGLWLKASAASAASTLATLVLSMLGGLWFPLSMMPDAMADFAQILPSYWAGKIGSWPIVGGDFPTTGVLVLACWTVALIILAAVGYRRAVRTSRR